MGFVSCKNEPCLYKRRNSGKLALIAIYVDDLILGCSSQDDLTTIKRELANAFDIVDKGPISHFLGMEVERDGDTGAITVGHKQYILNLLKKCGMTDCRPASTPLDAGYQIKRSDDTEKQIDPTSYQSLIGALMYLAVTTRPDISHSVSKLAQCNINPKAEHEIGAKHVLRYLAKTIDYKLRYYADNSEVCGYVDADWGGDLNDRKSYSGYLFMMAGATISWESKKQTIVALSTTEAEYVALSTAAKEAIYLKNLLTELGFHSKDKPILLRGDNISAQHLAKNHLYHARTKHIDIKFHHVRESIESGDIVLKYISTKSNLADVLTKNLTKAKHSELVKLMGLY